MIYVYFRNFQNTLTRIRVNSLKISSSENEASKARFNVILDIPSDISDVPAIANEIVIKADNEKIFGGYVISRSFEFISKDKYWEIKYEAIDYNHILDRYVIQPIDFTAQSVYAILVHLLSKTDLAKEWIGNWTGEEFKREPIDKTGIAKQMVIAKFKTGYTTAKGVLKEIQNFFPELKFWIDYSRNFYIYRDRDKLKQITIDFRPKIPLVIDNTTNKLLDYTIYSASLEEDATDFRNRQFIKGATQKEQKEDIITISEIEELKKIGFYLNQNVANDIKNRYKIEVPSELYNEYYTVPIIKIQESGNAEIKYLFAVATDFVITGTAEIEYDLGDEYSNLKNPKDYQPQYGDPNVVTPEVEEKGVKVKAVAIIWKHRSKDLYAVAMEGIDKGEYNEQTGSWQASGTNFWFFIPNTSIIWRHAPIKKTITLYGAPYDLYQIKVGITTSKALVAVASREGFKINDMFNPIKPEKYEGGYWDDIQSESSISTMTEAKALAEKYLDVYCKIPITLTIETSYPFLTPGDDIVVKFPALFEDGKHFRVKEVETEDIGGKLIRTKIRLIGSEKPHWIEFFRRLISKRIEDVEVEEYIMYTIGKDIIKAKDRVYIVPSSEYGLIELSHIEVGKVC